MEKTNDKRKKDRKTGNKGKRQADQNNLNLSRVLHCLADANGPKSIQVFDLFLRIFGTFKSRGKLPVQFFTVETEGAVRNYFSGPRPLQEELSNQFLTPEGFEELASNIRDNYLIIINEKERLYKILWDMLHTTPELNESQKKCLGLLFQKVDTAKLSYLAAACIVIGNYHTKYQHDKKKIYSPGNGDIYGLSFDFLSSDNSEMKWKIWKGARDAYNYSRSEGNCFGTLDIIDRLLPKGHIHKEETDLLEIHFDCPDKELKSLKDICESGGKRIAIIGEGGIGKTTFLVRIQQYIFGKPDEKLEDYSASSPVPIFIELNKCPATISGWYQEKYQKTNFITRQIADMVASSSSDNLSPEEYLDGIEQEFRMKTYTGVPTYMLLLDGFNEVSTKATENGFFIRELLSQEITDLCKLPNVRVITTSRMTIMDYYIKDFVKVPLKGLSRESIENHLLSLGPERFSPPYVGYLLTNRNLVNCLRVPLFLSMYSANDQNTAFIPETYGEIMYHFFHKTSHFYSLRARAEDAKNDPLKEFPNATRLALDFVLPYIGWQYEREDTFFMDEGMLENTISTALSELGKLLSETGRFPAYIFGYDSVQAKTALQAMERACGNGGVSGRSAILSCFHGYLGILYSFVSRDNAYLEEKFGFLHHHFRDYFSSVWIVNCLKLLRYRKKKRINIPCLNTRWNRIKAETVGHILLEHHNKPVLDPVCQNWFLPEYKEPEQHILTDALDYLRNTEPDVCSVGYSAGFLQNIIDTMSASRGELSGVCFDGLDFNGCSLLGVNCSRKGKSETLTATFNGIGTSKECFFVEPIQRILEFLYVGSYCITVDKKQSVHIWDLISNTSERVDPKGEKGNTYIPQEHMLKASPDCLFVGIKRTVRNEFEGRLKSYIQLVFINRDVRNISNIYMPGASEAGIPISDFIFSLDSSRLYVLIQSSLLFYYDRVRVPLPGCIDPRDAPYYEYRLQGRAELKGLCSECFLFAGPSANEVYIFTYYTAFQQVELNMRTAGNMRAWRDNEKCKLFRYKINESELEEMFEYGSQGLNTPVFAFFPEHAKFFYFDHCSHTYRIFNTTASQEAVVLQGIKDENACPYAIHYLEGSHGIFHIMYCKKCYQVEFPAYGNPTVMKIFTPPAIDDFGRGGLDFLTQAVPSKNRFLLRANTQAVYEWEHQYGTVVAKYNTTSTSCIRAFADKNRGLGIFVYQHSGFQVFRLGDALEWDMHSAFCYKKPDDEISDAAYLDKPGLLALAYKRGNAFYIETVNIENSVSQVVYSSDNYGRGSITLFSSPDGTKVLIVTESRCMVFRPGELQAEIFAADPGDYCWYVDGFFADNNTIHLAVASVPMNPESRPKPHVQIYAMKGQAFCAEGGYWIPKICNEPSGEGVNGSLFYLPCSHSLSDRVYKGFFMRKTDRAEIKLELETFRYNEDGERLDNGKVKLRACEFFCFEEDFSTKNDSNKQELVSIDTEADGSFKRFYTRDGTSKIRLWKQAEHSQGQQAWETEELDLAEGGENAFCLDSLTHVRGSTFLGIINKSYPFLVKDGRIDCNTNCSSNLAVCGCPFHNINPEMKEFLKRFGCKDRDTKSKEYMEEIRDLESFLKDNGAEV